MANKAMITTKCSCGMDSKCLAKVRPLHNLNTHYVLTEAVHI